MGELEPDQGLPPRAVEPWTRVVGHTVVDNAGRQFCSCGWRGAAVGATVEEHLRNAWPVLVARGEGQTRLAWRARVGIMHRQAVDESGQLGEKHRMSEPVQPGQRSLRTPRSTTLLRKGCRCWRGNFRSSAVVMPTATGDADGTLGDSR